MEIQFFFSSYKKKEEEKRTDSATRRTYRIQIFNVSVRRRQATDFPETPSRFRSSYNNNILHSLLTTATTVSAPAAAATEKKNHKYLNT